MPAQHPTHALTTAPTDPAELDRAYNSGDVSAAIPRLDVDEVDTVTAMMGATWRGVVGAAVGAMLELFWFPVGLILFPVAGAVLCEMAGGRAWREAGRAGAGAAIGMLAGAVGKVAFCLGMIGLFLLNVLFTLFRT